MSRTVNNNWLYDILIYLLYSTLGGPALVLLKALAIVVVTAFIIRLGWKEGFGWLASFAGLLALLVLGPWLAFRPLCASYLFLVLTLWLLTRDKQSDRPIPRLYAPLFLLFLLWVNIDGWFFLGPMTVGLFFLGEFLPRGSPAHEPDQRKTLGLALLVALAACLINPQHVMVFGPRPRFRGWKATIFCKSNYRP